MPISLIKSPRVGFGDEAAILQVDATIRETHTRQAEAPTSPVEKGSDITDHVRPRPEELRLEGFITDTPVTILGSLLANDPLSLKSGQAKRTSTAYEILTDLFERGEPFNVVTGLQVYKDMVFTRLNIPRDQRSGQAFTFSAQMRHVRIVASRTVGISADQVRDDPDGTADQAQSTKDVGPQSGQEPSDATGEQSSLLLKSFEGLGLL